MILVAKLRTNQSGGPRLEKENKLRDFKSQASSRKSINLDSDSRDGEWERYCIVYSLSSILELRF